MNLRCRNCKSTAIKKTSTGRYLCSICLHVTKEKNVYTDEFKKIKFTKQIKVDKSSARDNYQKKLKNIKLHEYLQSKKIILLKFFLSFFAEKF